jgi:hypothetical protein
MQGIILSAAIAAVLAVCGDAWIRRRRRRYERQQLSDFNEIRAKAKTGDIILFHKTRRKGFMDVVELDLVSPMLFGQTEFRHCGIIVKRDDELFVVECADKFHSGHSKASYLKQGKAVRLIPLETALDEYTRDNGTAHFGIKHIAQEIPLRTLYTVLEQHAGIGYLRRHKTAQVLFSNRFFPRAVHRRIVDAYKNEMMCSEFLHSVLNKCQVLKDYPSKLFVPYYISNSAVFQTLEIVKYSDIVRFAYGGYSALAGAVGQSVQVGTSEA